MVEGEDGKLSEVVDEEGRAADVGEMEVEEVVGEGGGGSGLMEGEGGENSLVKGGSRHQDVTATR